MFNAKAFLENESLYTTTNISIEDLEELLKLNNEAVKISIYCTDCKETRVFQIPPQSDDSEDAMSSFSYNRNVFYTTEEEKLNKRYDYVLLNMNIRHLHFECAYDNSHHFDLLIKVIRGTPDKIMKIGQFPSVADLESRNIQKFRSALGNDYLQEYSRAIGLSAHGIGIGSFVYLRRVFEKLIYEAFSEAEKDGILTDEQFNYDDKKHPRRMEDKIRSLKGYLPEIVIKNAGIYGVLSKGIHELSETECLGYYPVVNSGIKFMLEFYLDKKRDEQEKADFAKQIAKIVGETKT